MLSTFPDATESVAEWLRRLTSDLGVMSSSPARDTFFRAQEPKAPVTYCDHALSGVCRPSSVVRLSSVCRPLDYLHFRLLLQNRLMDFDETWYGWSTQGPLQVLLFLGQIRPGVDPGRGKNRSRGSPSSGNFLFRPEGYSNKPNT